MTDSTRTVQATRTSAQADAFRQLPGMTLVGTLAGDELLVRLHGDRLFVLETSGLLRPFKAGRG